MREQFELLHYQTADGRIPYRQWLDGVKDANAFAAVQSRTDRLRRGLFGDCRSVGGGVWELRIDMGPGYRVYYAQSGRRILLLLCGGDKRKQVADIRKAKDYWSDYEQRTSAGSGTR